MSTVHASTWLPNLAEKVNKMWYEYCEFIYACGQVRIQVRIKPDIFSRLFNLNIFPGSNLIISC